MAVVCCARSAAKRLIQGLLQKDPADRMSLQEFLASPWINCEQVSKEDRPQVTQRLSHLTQTRHKLRVCGCCDSYLGCWQCRSLARSFMYLSTW